jgi:hypothetical protein
MCVRGDRVCYCMFIRNAIEQNDVHYDSRCRILGFPYGIGFSDFQMVSDSQIVSRYHGIGTMNIMVAGVGFSDSQMVSDSQILR